MRWIALFLITLNIAFYAWQVLLEKGQISYSDGSQPLVQFNVDFAQLEPLQLLSEMPDIVEAPQVAEIQGVEAAQFALEVEVVDPDAEITSAEVAASIEDETCLRVGPFEDKVSAKQVGYRLQAVDIIAETESIEREREPLYWIYLAPSPSRDVALNLLRELQGKRIDSFLVTEGEFENSISLGFFSRKELAEQEQRRHIMRGYSAEIHVKRRTYDEYWLIISHQDIPLLSDELFHRVTEEYRGIKKEEKTCKFVAL
jgi:hypothetical protein